MIDSEPHSGARHPQFPIRPTRFDPSNWTRNNLADYTLLRVTDTMTYLGREFFDRKTPIEQQVECSLGDEVINISVTSYHYTYASRLREGEYPPAIIDCSAVGYCAVEERTDSRANYQILAVPEHREAIACIGHKFGTTDVDEPEMWKDLRAFFVDGSLPALCLTDTKEKERFLKRANRFIFFEERLWLKPNKKSSSLPRLVIEDNQRRQELLVKVHDECGHRGRDPTYVKLAERVYWPNMYNDCAYFVRSCVPCQFESNAKPIIPYNPSWMSSILRHWHMDCIHMPLGIGGKQYLVQATCSASKWDEAEAIRKANADTIAKFIYKLVCRFSCIPYITVDGGSEFKGVAEEVFRQYGIVVIVSTAYHPEGNGVSERAHQTLVHGLMKACHKDKSKWPLYVDAILFSIRVTTNRVTGYPPYYMVYGIFPVFAFDIEDGTWQTLDWDTVRTTADLIALRARQIARRDEDAEISYERARFSRQQAIDNFNKRYGKNFSFHGFDVGMWVLRHETWLDNQFGKKDFWRWSGPYIIHEKRDNNTYVLRELNGTVMRGHVTAHRLKLFFFRSENHVMKTVTNIRLYYDVQHFEKHHIQTLRSSSGLHAARHPDIDYYHYNKDPHGDDLLPIPDYASLGARFPLRILYFPGMASKPANLALTYRPHWGGSICDDPAYESFESWSKKLASMVTHEALVTEKAFAPANANPARYALGFIQP